MGLRIGWASYHRRTGFGSEILLQKMADRPRLVLRQAVQIGCVTGHLNEALVTGELLADKGRFIPRYQ